MRPWPIERCEPEINDKVASVGFIRPPSIPRAIFSIIKKTIKKINILNKRNLHWDEVRGSFLQLPHITLHPL